jgi:transposase, IS5 family
MTHGASLTPKSEWALQKRSLRGHHLEAAGYLARGGQIIDATIVSVPKQRNTKEENEAIKAGQPPEKQPAKNAQKDKDARWTKRNDESLYGYKNHIGVDKAHKLIRKWDATDAAVHDSRKLSDVLDPSNTSKEVWADSAYRSVEIEARLKEEGLHSRGELTRMGWTGRARAPNDRHNRFWGF